MGNKQLANKITKTEKEIVKIETQIRAALDEKAKKEEYLKKLNEIKKREDKLAEQQRALNEEIMNV